MIIHCATPGFNKTKNNLLLQRHQISLHNAEKFSFYTFFFLFCLHFNLFPYLLNILGIHTLSANDISLLWFRIFAYKSIIKPSLCLSICRQYVNVYDHFKDMKCCFNLQYAAPSTCILFKIGINIILVIRNT